MPGIFPCGVVLLAVAAANPALDRAARTAGSLPRLYSLLVSRQGEIGLERYYHGARPNTPADLKSASKSVISALVGIAIERKLIPGVNAPIAPYFQELLAADPAKSKVTIEDLLSMRSGLVPITNRNYGAWVLSPNWIGYILRRPMNGPPGQTMQYSTGNSHLLSAILTKAAGESTWAFANQVLAKPLGFTLWPWMRDPQGIFFGGNEMTMTPRQMVAFGELYLRRGRAGGKQVVPEAWVDASFVPRGRSGYSGQLYGYGWWIRRLGGRQVYYAWGYGGQFIFIVPDLEMVVVTTSAPFPGPQRREQLQGIYEMVEKLIEEQ